MVVFECIKSVIENENKKYVIDEESLRIANESHLLPFLYLSMDGKYIYRYKRTNTVKI